MKTSGKLLHNFTSLFRQSSTSHKRKASRNNRLQQLEQLETRQLLTVPALSSNPNAPVTIYLDFDGYTAPGQGFGVPVIYLDGTNSIYDVEPLAAFNLDNNVGPDSAEEERMIEEIFLRVSEDFAPFTVNVTTIAPASNASVITVAIGDDGAVGWNSPLGGPQTYLFSSPAFAVQGAYTTRPANPVLVFPQQLQVPNGENIAREISRGVGYQLGLTDLQPPATANTSGSIPIMEDPGVGELRNIWGNGDTLAGTQSDIAVMTGLGAYSNPGFRLRQDDIPGNIGGATPAQNSLQAASQVPNVPVALGSGLIGVTAVSGAVDSDFHRLTFRFLPTGTAQVSLYINGLDLSTHQFLGGQTDSTLNPGSNLDIVANLYNSVGQIVATSNLTPSISGRIDYEIPASSIPSNRIATYYLEVTTTSEYGSLGRYTIGGTLQELLGAPTILAPTGNVDTITPTFSWTPSLQATSYVLEVSKATTGAVVFSKTTNATQYTVNPEDATVQPSRISGLPQGNYSVRVKAVRGAGGANNESAWSSSVTFTVDVPLPSKPTIIRPKTVTGEPFPTFEWTKGIYDKGFTIQVFKKGTSTRVIYKTNLAASSYVHFSPLPNGVYTFNVRAYNAANEAGSLSDSVDFTVNAPLPVAPRLTAPTGTTTSIRPRIVWNAVSGAAYYDLKVDNLSTGVTDYIRQSRLTRLKTYYDPPTMTQGNYRAFVRGISGDGKAGAWSPVRNFTLNLLPPEAPTVTGPRGLDDSPTIQSTNPTFTWTVPVRGVKYDLLVNNLTTQTAGVIRQNGLRSTSFTAVSNLAQGSYRVWVRAYNAANEVGDWSAPFDFNIDEPTPSVPTITAPVVNSLGYVENANPTFTWTTGTPPAAAYDFTLFDVTLGKTVINVVNLTDATYVVPVARRLSEHTYSARVRAKNVSGDASKWSTAYQFRVNVPDPTTPILVGPGDTSTDTTPTFSWRHTATSFTYELLIRDLLRNEDITVQVKSFSLDPGGVTASYTLPAANALKVGTYRFWVRAFNSLGQSSSWSTSKTFVITVKLDENPATPEGVTPDFLAEAQIASALTGRTSVPVQLPAEESIMEEVPLPEDVVVADQKPAGSVVVTPEVPGEESLIDDLMHRLADPSASADLVFFRS